MQNCTAARGLACVWTHSFGTGTDAGRPTRGSRMMEEKNPDAARLETVTFGEALKKGLKVVDSTAFSLCMDNKMPMRIFGMEPTGNITQAILGAQIGTLVTN